MVLAVILIETEADPWGGGCGRGGGSHTPLLQNYYKKCTELAWIYKQKYLGRQITHISHKIWTFI